MEPRFLRAFFGAGEGTGVRQFSLVSLCLWIASPRHRSCISKWCSKSNPQCEEVSVPINSSHEELSHRRVRVLRLFSA